jgi:hypothetical protein
VRHGAFNQYGLLLLKVSITATTITVILLDRFANGTGVRAVFALMMAKSVMFQ